jgi:hypothetical protein
MSTTPAIQEVWIVRSQVSVGQGKNVRPNLKNKISKTKSLRAMLK